MEKEILEGSETIARFMGYVHIKDNVLYDTCDDTSFKHYTYETVYSKTPIYVDSEDFLQEVKNPDYGNNDNPRWNNNLETLNWASLNEHFINPQYHTSWDWIMPVVDKIMDIDITPAPQWAGYRMEIVPNGYVKLSGFPMHTITTNVSIEGSLIKAVWKDVVQFIHFYNTQSK